MGPCAKQQVVCIIKFPSGRWFRGENECRNPQPTCPREPGEDYTKCKTICRQDGHAEIMAIKGAKTYTRDLSNASATVLGHTRICTDCEKELHRVGITDVQIYPEIPSWMA